jgi:hypothetical protein
VDHSRFDVDCCAASRWITVATVATVAVRYLSTLDKYTAALYAGDPSSIIDALPGLMNNIKMMLTIARCDMHRIEFYTQSRAKPTRHRCVCCTPRRTDAVARADFVCRADVLCD